MKFFYGGRIEIPCKRPLRNNHCTVTHNRVNSQKHISNLTPTIAGTEIDKSRPNVSSKQSINSETFAKPLAAPARTAKGKAFASEAQQTPLNRPRRNAAVVGELVCRDTSS